MMKEKIKFGEDSNWRSKKIHKFGEDLIWRWKKKLNLARTLFGDFMPKSPISPKFLLAKIFPNKVY